MLRIGHGYDVHAFGGDNPLILGGVKIEHPVGLIAHSDGDVVLHSICDALLGAAALGDIGQHFPDTDEKFAGADSRSLLKVVSQMLHEKGFKLNNLDVTIVAQSPKMAPYILAMRQNVTQDLDIKIEQVNVKATTTESLGYIGRKEGIAVHAVVIIQEISQ